MSRIQKRRQQKKEQEQIELSNNNKDDNNNNNNNNNNNSNNPFETTLSTNLKEEEGGEKENEKDGKKKIPQLSMRVRKNLNEDEKPKSDDENEPKSEKLKIDTNIPDPKSNNNLLDDEKPQLKPFGRPPRADKEKLNQGQLDNNNNNNSNNNGENKNDSDNKNNEGNDGNQNDKDLEKGPIKILQPLRSDPLSNLKNRHKKLERLNAESIPEVHFIGKILSGEDIIQDKSEGGTCRWKVDPSPSWLHLGGDLQGQSHIAYSRKDTTSELLQIPFDHPLDLHFAESGIPGWGTPRLSIQTYRLDVHGRRILGGYGFTHFPMSQGRHILEISLWRPIGTPNEELESYLLGRTPALLTSDPIYDTAWQDRERLITTTAGKIIVELFVLTRYMYKHNIDR